MRQRVHRTATPSKCDAAARLHDREGRKPFADAFHAVCNGHVKMVAAELGISPSRIYRMTGGDEPTYGCQMARAIDRAIRENSSDPFAELRLLCSRYGLTITAEQDTNGLTIEEALAQLSRDCGEFIALAIEARRDGKMTADEWAKLQREGQELKDGIDQALGIERPASLSNVRHMEAR